MVKKVVSYGMVVLIALMMALNYQLFVFPNRFAPAGLNGVFTMIQYVTGFKLSHASIILNVPLSIIIFFAISKSYALRGMVYTLSFSGFLMLLDLVDLSPFVYSTTVSTFLGPAVAGLITGFGGYYMHQLGTCYGGTEFLAKLIHKKNPSFNFFTIIFMINVAVAISSYFVYDYKIEPVLLCILYSYMSSSVRDNMNRKHQSAVRCEIVTEDADKLGQQILLQLHHSVTVMEGRGLYSGKEKTILVCVLNPTQITELTRLVKEFPDSFVTVSPVSSVIGNFRRLDSHSNPEKEFFDSGIK